MIAYQGVTLCSNQQVYHTLPSYASWPNNIPQSGATLQCTCTNYLAGLHVALFQPPYLRVFKSIINQEIMASIYLYKCLAKPQHQISRLERHWITIFAAQIHTLTHTHTQMHKHTNNHTH